MLRFLLWRLLGLLAIVAGFALIAWFIDGGPGKLLRGDTAAGRLHLSSTVAVPMRWAAAVWSWAPAPDLAPVRLLSLLTVALALLVAIVRVRARRRRRYVRLRVEVYRSDRAEIEAGVAMFGALHKRLLRRWWRRLLLGQPSLSLEVHHTGAAPHSAWLAISARKGRSGWSKHRYRPPIQTAGCVASSASSACRRRCCA